MKSVNEIRDMIEARKPNPNCSDEFQAVRTAMLAMLDHVEELHSDILDCDKRIGQTPTGQVVPAWWYRGTLHSTMKLYRELLALTKAVYEFEGAQLKMERQREILAEDSEYQRLLAEEQPLEIYNDQGRFQGTQTFQEWKDSSRSPMWGKGLEEVLEVQKRGGAPEPVDYTKPHTFELDGESGLKHTGYRLCVCGLSEGNDTFHI